MQTARRDAPQPWNEQALETADPFLVLTVLAYLTGEQDWLAQADGAASKPGRGPGDVPEAVRRSAIARLGSILASGDVEPKADVTLLPRIVRFCVGEPVPDEYMPMLLDEAGVAPRPLDQFPPLRAGRSAEGRPEVAIVGAGLSGVALAVHLKRLGIPFVIYEKNEGVGGTWYDNRYPGCGVDTTSHFYTYSFALNPNWSRYFTKQPDMLAYIDNCVDRFGIREHIRFGHTLAGASYDETRWRWRLSLRTADGETAMEAAVLVSAIGQLNVPSTPGIPGLDTFAGPVMHTSRWDPDFDHRGKRVVLLGSGASAVQVGPSMAPEVERRDIKFATRMRSARFLETKARWEMVTAAGDVLHARFCIMATGCLSSARIPRLPGMERFRGRSFHTGGWPHEPVSFEGERVGVIGTGSSGIQAIPLIAREAANLFVFQRTPNFSVPAQNWPMPEEYERAWKRDYPALRRRAREASTSGSLTDPGQHKVHDIPPQEREQLFEARWNKGGVYFLHAFTDLLLDEASNKEAADFVRRKIRSIVKDAAVADLLTPTDHAIGAKRICVDTHYYDTFNRPNVTLVDLRSDPIEEVTVTGLRTTRKEYALDAIVYATGYDAMTGALLNMEITGRGGLTLQDKWQDGPRSYLGMMVAGFPNLFTITGPGSPSVLSNMIFSIEQHVEWIGDCLEYLEQNRISTIEAQPAAEEEWVEHVNAVADRTLYPKAASWYTGANVPGKPRVFMPYVGGVVAYRSKCDTVAAAGYSGFTLARAEVAETSMA